MTPPPSLQLRTHNNKMATMTLRTYTAVQNGCAQFARRAHKQDQDTWSSRVSKSDTKRVGKWDENERKGVTGGGGGNRADLASATTV
jgi:hypothetical protein